MNARTSRRLARLVATLLLAVPLLLITATPARAETNPSRVQRVRNLATDAT